MKLERGNHVMNRACATTLLIAVFLIHAQAVSLAHVGTSSFESFMPTEIHNVATSDGVMYDVYISMPLRYDPSSDSKYPVVYVTDGAGPGFVSANIAAKGLQLDGVIRPVILVGVDSPWVSIENSQIKRFHMLTPTRSEVDEQEFSETNDSDVRSGGAAEFRSHIKSDIIPWIEGRYPASGERALVGYSVGGLFVADTLFKDPELFSNYLIGSPFLRWDDKVIFSIEESYSSDHKNLSARVFLSVGEEESYRQVSNSRRLFETLKSRNYPGLELDFRVFEDETHIAGVPTTMTTGLRYLFSIDE